MAPLTAVAVSGGVDSLVAAHRLRQRGHRLVGIHFTHGHESPGADRKERIAGIGRQVGIPVEFTDCADDFQKEVVDYFTRAYRKGLTPNPCMVCNPRIKFGAVLDAARRLGATRLATGHYARVERDGLGRFHLLRGMDGRKEQSYFLAFLNQRQLAAACFPLGGMTKAQTVRYAAGEGLRPAFQEESQDVCFIRRETYGDFLDRQAGFESVPGPIEDLAGNVIGRHGGLHLFTVGQRRGINCPAPEPYYVVRLDMGENRLVVGSKKDLLSAECTLTRVHWIGSPPREPLAVLTRVRYRSPAVASTVVPLGTEKAVIRFDTPQSAVTPGQAAVFYSREEVLGAGWIETA